MNDLEQIKIFYEQAFKFFDPKDTAPRINVEFYSYVGINNTIRVRSGEAFVRLSEICRDAPLLFQKALAFILVGKLRGKKIPPDALKIYRAFVQNSEIQAKAIENKRLKGRKFISASEGEFYNLEEIFDRLNHLYFQNSIQKPTLTWSQKKTFRMLGHHDSTHETIVVSKSLDDGRVPPFVVEFVVFHEMLHVFHPTVHRNHRRYNHTPQFRADERKFAYFDEAENWIEQNAGNLKRKARRKLKSEK